MYSEHFLEFIGAVSFSTLGIRRVGRFVSTFQIHKVQRGPDKVIVEWDVKIAKSEGKVARRAYEKLRDYNKAGKGYIRLAGSV
ncbi:hypothetical protein R1flu_024249 [Riccia fluitans]|uniref:GIY-YIG homing endonuclease n=1 Tax=Riccia fluitans TaxID=41844 RepID=A0ABD1XUC5_9MARC